MKGRMLVHKYSMFRGTLYAAAGATVYLVEYRGTVAIVQDENGNRFPAQASEVYFGDGPIDVSEARPREAAAPSPGNRRSGRKTQVIETPTLF